MTHIIFHPYFYVEILKMSFAFVWKWLFMGHLQWRNYSVKIAAVCYNKIFNEFIPLIEQVSL